MMGVIKPSPHISNFSINVQNVLKEIKYITSLLSETFSSLIFYVSFKRYYLRNANFTGWANQFQVI